MVWACCLVVVGLLGCMCCAQISPHVVPLQLSKSLLPSRPMRMADMSIGLPSLQADRPVAQAVPGHASLQLVRPELTVMRRPQTLRDQYELFKEQSTYQSVMPAFQKTKPQSDFQAVKPSVQLSGGPSLQVAAYGPARYYAMKSGAQFTGSQSSLQAETPGAKYMVSRSLPQAGMPGAQFTGSQSLLQAGKPRVAVQGQALTQYPVLADYEPQLHISANSVRVACLENSLVVEVNRDLLGIGQLIDPSDITLGGCFPTGQDVSAGVLRFETELHKCGSSKTVDDELVYTFALSYMPKGLDLNDLVRTNGAVVSIECHYLRKHTVSSSALQPVWITYSAVESAEERLVFSLRLMNDDWLLERASNVYFLGDVINLEAHVVGAYHEPLRVFVDSCVATSAPDLRSESTYSFVDNYGCLADAKMTGSHSQFMPRKQNDLLQMRMEAFRFTGVTKGLVYISCILKAAVASVTTDAQHKACHFSSEAKRWLSADGDDQVCGCCDVDCGLGMARGITGVATLPVIIQEVPLKAVRLVAGAHKGSV